MQTFVVLIQDFSNRNPVEARTLDQYFSDCDNDCKCVLALLKDKYALSASTINTVFEDLGFSFLYRELLVKDIRKNNHDLAMYFS